MKEIQEPKMIPLNEENHRKIEQLILQISSLKEAELFLEPVNYIELGLTDYPVIIKKMMDFKTLKDNLQSGIYKSIREVLDDI